MIYKLSENQYTFLIRSYLHIDTNMVILPPREWTDLYQRQIIKLNEETDRYYLTFRGMWVIYLYRCNVI